MDLVDALRRIDVLADVDASAASRLAGLTNVNYLVHHQGSSYVVRLPGAGTSDYIDRKAEEVAARSAAAAGVNVDVVFFDPADGLMVTRYLEGAVTLSAERFRQLDAVARAGRALRRLHDQAAPFATDFVLFPMIDEYKALLAGKRATLPEGYAEAQATAERARVALARHPARLVPSHCDPVCENFLDTGERMFIIDYEYAGNNDPMWDLGDLSVEGGFAAEQDRVLVDAYFDGPVPADEAARMLIYKALCDLLWTLWGVLQHVNGNPADDFWAYAVGRFERCRTLMHSPAFADALTELE
jgi:thiamine kinase-like enzyme